MSIIATTSPEATYATKPNIMHPGSSTDVTAANAKANADLSARLGVTVTGAAIKQAK